MATDLTGGLELASTGSGVHGDWLADNEAIGDELSDGLTRVGVANLVDFVWVEPDLPLAASYNGRREALLGGEIDPGIKMSAREHLKKTLS